MENLFIDVPSETLKHIYVSILNADFIGNCSKLLEPYIYSIKSKYGIEGYIASKLAKDMFYEEVAIRYFSENEGEE